MELVIINDMRAPDWATPRSQLFAAALDIAAWADKVGFDVLGLGEHHSSDDGYNPSPLILASAFAARTQRIRLRTAVLLASCYDPIRLAEDIAVLQILSGGRFELGLGFGYRQCEFKMYRRDVKDRFKYTLQVAEALKQAWTGESFEYEGRPCLIAPIPEKPVPLMLGATAPAVARAAARVADGFIAPLFGPDVWQPYREECIKLGKRDPGVYPKQGPTFLWVSEDPDRDWEWLTPHILHIQTSYGRWTTEAYGTARGVYQADVTIDTIRNSNTYQVLTPKETRELIADLGDNSSLYLTPLLAGADPKRAWEMLRLFEREVYPHVPRGVMPSWCHTQ